MATSNQKLADSMAALHALQHAGRTVIRSTALTRTHLQRLTAAGYLRLVVKGWYMPWRPGEDTRDTTAWFASRQAFVSAYCNDRFGGDWYVNAEVSLLLHTGATALPLQIQIHAVKGKNNLLALPANTSLFDYAAKDFAPPSMRTVVQGMRALTLEAALLRAGPNAWQADPATLRLALEQLIDASQLSRLLLDGGNSVIAGRLIGGLRAVGRDDLANDLVENMKAAAYVVPVSNPFAASVLPVRTRAESPYCARIRTMWEAMRAQVLATWKTPRRPVQQAHVYLHDAEERYVADAYNSLSIEGYQVTPELLEAVRSGQWSPDQSEADKRDRNALAARGYYEAHLQVRESLTEVLGGANPGDVLRRHLQTWYRALWTPSVQAGLLKPSDLAGWRAGPVYIRNSMHVPLPPEAVRDAMPLLFELLASESEPQVQAVLGHFVFVFIHPYMDGNGRLARFILNLMLSCGGWPWTVVTLEARKDYMDALEDASVRQDIVQFTALIDGFVRQQREAPLKRPGTDQQGRAAHAPVRQPASPH